MKMQNIITTIICCYFGLLGIAVQAQTFDDHKVFSSGSGAITIVRFDHQNELFASGNSKGRVVVRKVSDTRIANLLQAHDGAVHHLSFHKNQPLLLTCGKDKNVRVWNLGIKANVPVYDLTEQVGVQSQAANFAFFNQSGQDIFYGVPDGTIYIVRDAMTKSPQRPATLIHLSKGIYKAALNKVQDKLLIASDKSVFLFNPETQKVRESFRVCPKKVVDVKFTPDEKSFGCLCDDGTFGMYDLASGKEIVKRKMVAPGKTELAFSPDGIFVVIGDPGKEPKVYYTENLSEACLLVGHIGPVRTVTFSADSKNILSAGDGQFTKMWKFRKLYGDDIPKSLQEPLAPLPPTPTPVAPTPNNSMPPPIMPTTTKPEVKPINPVDTIEALVLKYNKNRPDSLGNRKVQRSQKIRVKTDVLEFVVWDEEYVDGDTISLYFNGNWLLKGYALTASEKRIKVKIDPNIDNYLILHAHNEGTKPPNTVALRVFDGVRERKITLMSSMRVSDAILFEPY